MATPNELTQETVAGLAARLRAREVSAVEVTQAFLARADALEPDAHIFITRTPEPGRREARGTGCPSASRTSCGWRGCGVPLARR
jgi:aspartyl-tRNA(Asn)/glutamyl-tRNA(Gln) amidotransferase subunit A